MGSGDVFVKAGETLMKRDLEASGCLVAFTTEVDFGDFFLPIILK